MKFILPYDNQRTSHIAFASHEYSTPRKISSGVGAEDMMEQKSMREIKALPRRFLHSQGSESQTVGGEGSMTMTMALREQASEISSSLETPPPSSMESDGTLSNQPNPSFEVAVDRAVEIIDLSGPEYRPRTPPEQTSQDQDVSGSISMATDLATPLKNNAQRDRLEPATPTSSSRKRQMILTPNGGYKRPLIPLEPESPTKKRKTP